MENEYAKALIYCRVSSDKQVKEGSGLDSQEHRCRLDAESVGLEVEEVFREEGISGGLFDRPAMTALLKYLDDHWENKYTVIFDDLKRFARDVGVHRKLKTELHAREARLRCLNYQFDDSAEGEFVETIFAAQNELERKQNRRQVCQKMRARVERGYWCFKPPAGYEYRKHSEHGKLLTPIPAITDILTEALNGFAENTIINQLDFIEFLVARNYHELINNDKKRIDFDYVKGIMMQPLYAGIVEYKPWDIAKRKGQHTALISEETFEKIQNKLKRPDRGPREYDNREFPLRRVVDCAFCDRKLTGSTSKGKRKYYSHYTCNNKECLANPKNIIATKVETDYVQLLHNIKVEEEALQMGKVIAMRIWQRKVEEIKLGNAANEAAIKSLEAEIDGYVKLMPTARSESVRSRYEAMIDKLDQQIKDLQTNIVYKKEPNFEEALELTLKFLGTPAETWENSGIEIKNMVHNMIFTENPKYSLKNGFGTPHISLPFRLGEYINMSKSNLVDLRRHISNSSPRLL